MDVESERRVRRGACHPHQRHDRMDAGIDIVVVVLQVDGRKPNELRSVSFKLGISTDFDGSSYYKQGITEIYTFVEGPVHVASKYFLVNFLERVQER